MFFNPALLAGFCFVFSLTEKTNFKIGEFLNRRKRSFADNLYVL